MTDAVYQKAIMQLARDRSTAGRLDAPDGTATVDNPMCGDRVTIDLTVGDDGTVTSVRHTVRGCLLCEAGAALIGRCGPGASAAEVAGLAETLAAFLREEPVTLPDRWAEAEAFTPVRPVRNRHRCVTLPFEAAAKALRDALR